MSMRGEKETKACRMSIRLAHPQHVSYEHAASLRGQAITQWATTHLDESARCDIDGMAITILPPEAFEIFCKMLESPVPKTTQDLLARKPVWE